MKKHIKNSEELAQAIADLELKAIEQKREIRETFSAITESLKPINLIRNGFRSVVSGEHKEDLVKALIGMGTGLLSRKLIIA
jgi:hypothetical protein